MEPQAALGQVHRPGRPDPQAHRHPVGAEGEGTCLSDLDMTVNAGGREHTRADFGKVRRRAALRVTSVTPLADAAPCSPIEAVAG